MQFVEIEKYRPVLKVLSSEKKVTVRVVKVKDDWVTFKLGSFQIEAPISGIEVGVKEGTELKIDINSGEVVAA